MSLMNARLTLISEDVWYMHLPNGQQFLQPIEYHCITKQQLTD